MSCAGEYMIHGIVRERYGQRGGQADGCCCLMGGGGGGNTVGVCDSLPCSEVE